VVRATNRFIEVQQPWAQARAADAGPLHTTLYAAAEVLRVCAGLLMPLMPTKMAELRAALGMENPMTANPEEFSTSEILKPGVQVAAPGALFPRIEAPVPGSEATPAAVAAEAKAAASKKAPAPGTIGNPEGVITYEDFAKVQLRTAKIRPWASMASATLTKPAMLAPTRSCRAAPYSLAVSQATWWMET
jgi:methionyl-tRNA synthetase